MRRSSTTNLKPPTGNDRWQRATSSDRPVSASESSESSESEGASPEKPDLMTMLHPALRQGSLLNTRSSFANARGSRGWNVKDEKDALEEDEDDDDDDKPRESETGLRGSVPVKSSGPRILDETGEPCPAVVSGMLKKALFHGCSPVFLNAVTARAKRLCLGADQEFKLDPSSPTMLVVQSGAVRLTVGPGPSMVAGPGEVFNIAGFLSAGGDVLNLAAFNSGNDMPYEVLKATNHGGFHVFDARLPDKDMIFGGALTGDQVCFYSLCPYASAASRRASVRYSVAGRLPMSIFGGGSGEAPMVKCERADFMTGGCMLSMIDMQLLKSIAASSPLFKNELANINKNSETLLKKWHLVLERCRGLLVGAPGEVLWAATEVVEEHFFEEGERIVSEATSGPEGESLVIIHSGEADVEKLRGLSANEAEEQVIGHLGAGAIIGDWCLLDSGLPRPASVRAKSKVHALVLQAKYMLQLFRTYPGVLMGLEARLNKVAGFFANEAVWVGSRVAVALQPLRRLW